MELRHAEHPCKPCRVLAAHVPPTPGPLTSNARLGSSPPPPQNTLTYFVSQLTKSNGKTTSAIGIATNDLLSGSPTKVGTDVGNLLTSLDLVCAWQVSLSRPPTYRIHPFPRV